MKNDWLYHLSALFCIPIIWITSKLLGKDKEKMIESHKERQIKRISYEVYTYREQNHLHGLAELDRELAIEYLNEHRRENLYSWLEEKIGYGTHRS